MNVMTELRSQPARALRIWMAALTALAVAGFSTAASAQVETPPQGSPVRAAILEAIRGVAVAELGGPIEFVVNDIRVLGEWAYADVHPQRPGGGEIFYTYTRYQAAWDAGALDQTAVVLLRETPAGWLVFEYSFGATDVQWVNWVGMYPVPIEVFPGGGAGMPQPVRP
jgi:hypothetical protein